MSIFNKGFLLSVALLLVALYGCSDKEEPEPEEEFPGYVSMLVENSGWTTVAYDDDIFSGIRGASFAYEKEFVLGNVYNENPTFLAYRTIAASGSSGTPKSLGWHAIDGNNVVSVNYPVGVTLESSLNRSTLGGSLPDNIKASQTTGLIYHGIGRAFFYNGFPYASYTYYSRKAANLNESWKATRFVGVRKGDALYGIIPAIPSRLIREKSNLKVYDGAVSCYLGESDVMEVNGEETAVQFASFNAEELDGSNPGRYGCLTGKYWDGKDSVDFVSPSFKLPSAMYASSIACIDNICLIIERSETTRHIFIGGFDGVQEIHELPASSSIAYLLKGEEYFFVVYQTPSFEYEAIRISKSGNVTQLADIPFGGGIERIGSAAVYQDNLVIAFSEDNATYQVKQVGPNEVTSLGAEILTQPLEETGNKAPYNGASITLASDGESLFAAIKNNLSPKFAGRTTQWTAHEIIKFNE